ncbi:hypothetical protein ACG94M_04800 [Acinetobacter guillouiae]|uniref:hypothetical protein n=1 Tax=Acinetobacter guillouiae TaxID=106649 RepID=UPI003AF90469
MQKQNVERLANEIIGQFQCYFDHELGTTFQDQKLLNDYPFAKVHAISMASRVICRNGYCFEAEVDTTSQIPVIKYRAFKK